MRLFTSPDNHRPSLASAPEMIDGWYQHDTGVRVWGLMRKWGASLIDVRAYVWWASKANQAVNR